MIWRTGNPDGYSIDIDGNVRKELVTKELNQIKLVE